jgi:hypothetical protein
VGGFSEIRVLLQTHRGATVQCPKPAIHVDTQQ